MHDVQEPELLHDEEPAQAPRAGRVEEVLPALQQADGAQGVEVMTTAALEPHGQGWLRRAWDFVAGLVGAAGRQGTTPRGGGAGKGGRGGGGVFVFSGGVGRGMGWSVPRVGLAAGWRG